MTRKLKGIAALLAVASYAVVVGYVIVSIYRWVTG